MEDSKLEDPIVDYHKEYTYADYLRFNFEEMVELIRGKIFKMSPAPRTTHQKISGNLHRIIANYLHKKNCQIFIAPTDVILPVANKIREKSTTVVQPDLCIVCDDSMVEEAGIFGAPDLMLEILSPSTSKKDLQDKFSVYEEAGVKEYWIVSPEAKFVEVFVLIENRFQRIKSYVQDDMVESHTIQGLCVDLNDVFF
jgi:Uma2 family endonuclease